MASLFCLFWLIPLVALLAVSSRSAPTTASSSPVPTRTVDGIAVTPGGHPLAFATLYLFGLPPGQTDMITLGDQSTVVTDAQGRFTWAVPPALPPLSDYVGVRSIACYALAADRSTESLRLAVRSNWHGTDATGAARDLLGQVTRSCETKWLLGGKRPIFSVVVPDTSVVEMLVRGPGGQPVRARKVQVVPLGLTYDYMGAAVDTVRTDAAGRLRLRCFPGSLRFQVLVPGLGFGSTGTFDAAAGRTALAELPPLAPFAHLSGTIAPALTAPGAAIQLDTTALNENVWYGPRAAADGKGHWTMADVLPGPHRLLLDGGRGESEQVSVTVQPGQQISGLMIGPKSPVSGTGGPFGALFAPASSHPGAPLSIRGRVTDTQGRPAAGADVFANCYSSNGMSSRQTVRRGKADAAGAYLITDLPPSGGWPMQTAVHLVACQPGFGFAVGDWNSGNGDTEKDLVLPTTHAGLTVRVLRDGKPCPNVLVALSASGENSRGYEMFRGAERREAAQTLQKMLAPSGQTGPDGTVRFQDLTPGLWDVTANRVPFFDFLSKTPMPPFNVSAGVAVQAERDQTYTLSLLPVPSAVSFRVLGPDGVPAPAGQQVATLQTANNPNYGTLSLTSDSAGNSLGQFVAPGLFQVTSRFGDRPLDINALASPYNEGTAWVAVSAATAPSPPVSVPTQWIGPASLRVRLRDAAGKPLRGTVTVSDSYAASVDASGGAVFLHMPQSFFPYTVIAHITGRPERVVPSRRPGPLPSDAALIAGTGQPLPQKVRIKGGEETVVTFGPEPPGYVRLHLTGPFAAPGSTYIEGRQTDDEAFTDIQFDPATGEYLLGPLPPGRRTFHLFRSFPAPVAANLRAGEVTVTVKAGAVVSATVAAQSTAAEEAVYSAPLMGTVFLADGKTPAWGARAALFLPDSTTPIRMARTDALGRLVVNDYWRGSARLRTAPLGNPDGPVLAAWLPGECGAVIVPFQPGQDMRLALPPAMALHGRVTVGGQSALGLPSQFRIRAAYRGKGRLNEALSVEATAQADGTFTLAGLTPGTYQLQAARDGIWLSGTQTVTVGTGALPVTTLDIAPPGLPVVLKLVGRQGKPFAEQEVTIVRPGGPLTGEIWPARLTTDSAGRLRVDGLEAGPHLLTLPGQPEQSIGFEVPVWTPTAPAVTRRIVLPIAP